MMEDEEELARREIEQVRIEVEQITDRVTDSFYKAIGRGITTWSNMEGYLVHIAAWLLDTRRNKVGLIFYSINNFHVWLSIIDELFAMDPNFHPLRPDWIKIKKRLTKLNDVRVRLAHHALEKGKDLLDIVENDSDPSEAFPSLKPNRIDTRAKWKKSTISIEEIATFHEQLVEVIEQLGKLMERMGPIYLEPKRTRVAKIKELQQKAGQG
jgi:hypothetical protein